MRTPSTDTIAVAALPEVFMGGAESIHIVIEATAVPAEPGTAVTPTETGLEL